MIAIEHLRVELGGQPVLRDVSLTVPRGGWLAIAGPNGTGKSTLLRALAGGRRDGGRVTIDGRDVREMSRRGRARILAFAPQTPTIPPGVSVLAYALLGRTPHLGPLGGEGPADHAATVRALDALHLHHLKDRPVEQLSGGERQRAVMARALAQGASVLLLDEPTSALDLGHQQQVLDLVDRLRAERDLTVVSTSHDLTLIGQYADRLALLHEGTVLVDGQPAQVLTEANVSRCFATSVRLVDVDGVLAIIPHRGAPHAHQP